jgi:hypothetical protein
VIEFYYNPRSAPPHIQDKFGWNGEGMTDSNFLRTDIRPDQRCVYTSMPISKDQILSSTPVVLKTKNFRDSAESRDSNDDVIMVPSLRSSGGSATNNSSNNNGKG